MGGTETWSLSLAEDMDDVFVALQDPQHGCTATG